MATAILKDGREITIDLELVSVDEYRSLFKDETAEDVKDGIVAKAAGMELKELKKSIKTYKKVIEAFWKTAQEPLADPNSPSASS